MKILSVFYDGNEISLHNNLLGVESIHYNGNKMTSEFSWFGTTHHFTTLEGTEEVEYVVQVGYNGWGIGANITRNNEIILQGLNHSDFGSCYKKKKTESEFVSNPV